MSEDEFGWSSGDEEPFAATTDAALDGKRKLTMDSVNTTSLAKRNRHESDTTVAPSPSTILANRILKERFAIDGFRLEQERAITQLLDGGSAVVVLPTGGGKSLCYQASHVFVQ
jgi:superfamily II DNA helicase RecQ